MLSRAIEEVVLPLDGVGSRSRSNPSTHLGLRPWIGRNCEAQDYIGREY